MVQAQPGGFGAVLLDVVGRGGVLRSGDRGDPGEVVRCPRGDQGVVPRRSKGRDRSRCGVNE